MIQIPGYEIVRQEPNEGQSLIYYALRTADSASVILKVLQQDRTERSIEAQAEHEFKMLRRLEGTGVSRALDLLHMHPYSILVLDDGGHRIADFSEPLPLQVFLKYAVQLTGILATIHRLGVIHRDLKPDNILIHPETEEIIISDMGLAVEREHLVHQAVLSEGTLTHMAPEQTGRTHHTVDNRTDLYALGICFYQMLTGKLPFHAKDTLEWIHCHMAVPPTPPIQHVPDLPLVLSEMVLKLMAKDPEARYRYATSVQEELKLCEQAFQKGQVLPEFQPGYSENRSTFKYPERIYGREQAIRCLQDSFRLAAEGPAEWVCVSGISGIGKTALVKELQSLIQEYQGFFLTGKFDQFGRNVPYASIVQAFRELISDLLMRPEAELEFWKRNLEEILGENAQVITAVIPELKNILGDVSDVPELGAGETQNRFLFQFRNFVSVFARKEHPLVILLDDLQWADVASLHLLEYLLNDATLQHVFFIGAYRSNEVDNTHPLTLTLSHIEAHSSYSPEILLEPLKVLDIQELLSDALQRSLEDVEELATLLFARTAGNPLFIREFVISLVRDELLVFSMERNRWEWVQSDILQMAASLSVSGLISGNLLSLSDKSLQLLQTISCIGHEMDLTLLACIEACHEDEIRTLLIPAMHIGLIGVRDRGMGKSIINFPHDHIQKAAFESIPEENRAERQGQLGKRMINALNEEQQQEHIFSIVDNLNAGLHLNPENVNTELMALNLQAATKARNASAFDTALKYLRLAESLRPDNAWMLDTQESYALFRSLAEAEYLCGNFDKASQYLDEAYLQVPDRIRKAGCQSMRMVMLTNLGRHKEVIQVLADSLRLFGLRFPLSPNKVSVTIGILKLNVRLKIKFGNNPAKLLAKLPEMQNTDIRMIMELLVKCNSAAYLTDKYLVTQLNLWMMQFSLKYGNIESSAYAYSALATINFLLGDYKKGLSFAQLGMDLADKYKNPEFICKSYMIYGAFVNQWVNHFSTDFPYLYRAYQAGISGGDLIYSGYALNFIVSKVFISGSPFTETEQEVTRALEFIGRVKDSDQLHIGIVTRQFIRAMKGETRALHVFDSEDFNEEEYRIRLESTCHSPNSVHWYYWIRLKQLYYLGYYDAAEEFAVVADKIIDNGGAFATAQIPEQYFYCCMNDLARTEQKIAGTKKSFPPMSKRFHKHWSMLRTWSSGAPDNFRHKYLMVQGEWARCKGDTALAINSFVEAYHHALKFRFLHQAALAAEKAGKLYLFQQQILEGKACLTEACRLYRLWGAEAKAEQIMNAWPEYFTSTRAYTHNETKSLNGSGKIHSGQLDIATVMKAAMAISGELKPQRLIQTLLRILMENTGAQFSALLLDHQGRYLLEATGAIEEGEIHLHSSPGTDPSLSLPMHVLNYVSRTGDALVIDDVSLSRYFKDPYFQKKSVCSVLCFPVLHQQRILGLLYLENNQVRGAFSADRMTMLNMLAAQAAISLEHSRFYEHLEQRVEDRTRQLAEEKRLTELANQRLQSQKFDIEQQQFLILEKNKQITDSINYALRIQQGVLPFQNRVEAALGNMLLFYRPRDIVSGDFYWFHIANDFVWFAVADGTGHGVPGAFMSLIGINLLNEIIRGNDSCLPDTILDILNFRLGESLRQHNSVSNEVHDGMDIALFRWSEKDKVLMFAGAGRPLWICNGQDIVSIKGSKWGISGELNKQWESHEVHIKKGDKIYLFTDGIVDQFGGEAGRRLNSARLEDWIKDIYSLPMHDQQSALIKRYEDWVGHRRQLDDVLITGFDLLN